MDGGGRVQTGESDSEEQAGPVGNDGCRRRSEEQPGPVRASPAGLADSRRTQSRVTQAGTQAAESPWHRATVALSAAGASGGDSGVTP